MKTSPRIHKGPRGGGISMSMKPEMQMLLPKDETCRENDTVLENYRDKNQTYFENESS